MEMSWLGHNLLFCHLVGKTKDLNECIIYLNESQGEVGQRLRKCADLPAVNFLSIESNLSPLENLNDWRRDQKYLLHILGGPIEVIGN